MTVKSIHEWLEQYYHFVLMNTKIGKNAKDYLLQRGVKEDTMKQFKLGYSPADVKPTLGFLKAKGFSFNDLVDKKVLFRYKSGEYKGKLTDPFKNRIVFPIQNYRGKTVGFGGRSLNSENRIKYINTPETNIFIKGDNLYGFHFAKEEIENQGYAILYEGYFDAISAYQSGIKNSIATLGTALTVNQALLLKSVTKNVVIAFDGDKAGMESSLQSASVLESVGCTVRIAHMNDELDPDDFIKKNGKETFLKDVIAKAKPRLDSFIEYKRRDYQLSSPNERYCFAREVLEGLRTNKPSEVKNAIQRLGMILKVPLGEMYEEIKKGE